MNRPVATGPPAEGGAAVGASGRSSATSKRRSPAMVCEPQAAWRAWRAARNCSRRGWPSRCRLCKRGSDMPPPWRWTSRGAQLLLPLIAFVISRLPSIPDWRNYLSDLPDRPDRNDSSDRVHLKVGYVTWPEGARSIWPNLQKFPVYWHCLARFLPKIRNGKTQGS